MEKKVVDSFTPGKTSWIPHSQFKAILSRKTMDDIPALECEVDLIGAKEPHNKFTVDIRPSPGIVRCIILCVLVMFECKLLTSIR